MRDDQLGPGNLFATGLVAGGAVMGVVIAMLSAFDLPRRPSPSLHATTS